MMRLLVFCTASLLAIHQSSAWGRDQDDSDPKFSRRHQGRLVFVSENGKMATDPSLNFDEKEKTVKMDRFSADAFAGDSINFRGREIRNAALVDSTIEGLHHLAVDTLLLRSQASTGKHGNGLAMINGDGVISTTGHLRWDEANKALKISSLAAFTENISLNSDVDFQSHTLKNAKLSAGTVLDELEFRNGKIENSVLHNVTATGLALKDVNMDSLTISKFKSKPTLGSFLAVGEDGAIQATPTIKLENEERLLVDSKVSFGQSIDLNGHELKNAKLTSGLIDGAIDIFANTVIANELTIRDIQDDKTVTTDGLAVLGLDGKLRMSSIQVGQDGALGDIHVKGTIDFADGDSSSHKHGRVANADIVGGSISDLKTLNVKGDVDMGSGLHVSGDTFMDGSLTVSGSVLGSGPYVDVSDRRFKRNIKKIESADALQKILQLDAVSYDLDFVEMLSIDQFNFTDINAESQRRQLGFIAQDVEQVIPEIVYNDEEGWKGLHYSRLAPILVESIKQMSSEIDELKMAVAMLTRELNKTKA